jgi:hypothetical protein
MILMKKPVPISSEYFICVNLRKSAVKVFSYSRPFVSIRGLFCVHSRLHHWAESADDLGETSGYLAERTVFNTVDQLGESVASVFHDGG